MLDGAGHPEQQRELLSVIQGVTAQMRDGPEDTGLIHIAPSLCTDSICG